MIRLNINKHQKKIAVPFSKCCLLILFFLSLFVFTKCKKDYPKDIPKWLKKEIINVKKEENCANDSRRCPKITEWTNGDSVKYVFYFGFNGSYTYYNYEGTIIGICPQGGSCDPQTQSIFSGYSENRLIW